MDTKPTVLVLTSTFPREDGDHEPRFVAELCLELKDKFNIVVLTQNRPGASSEEYYRGIRVIRFRYAPRFLEILSETGGIPNTLKSKPLAWLLVPLFILAQLLATRKTIQSCKPTVIHAHWLLPQTLSALGSQVFIKNKIPVVTTAHGGDLYGYRNNLFRYLKRKLINSCTQFCVVSNAMANYAQKSFDINSDRISVCPMGVDLATVFTPDKTAKKNEKQILFAGRLVKKKGVAYLLKALAQLNGQKNKFELVIAGYGPEEESLKNLAVELCIQGQVTFSGSLDHEHLSKLLLQSALCVFPFIESDDGDMEGLGLVVLEAMGCKCPVIVGNVPAINDIVVDNETGLICDPKVTSNLTDAITNLHSDIGLKEKITHNAFKHVHTNYSWPACAERYAKVFEIVGSSK